MNFQIYIKLNLAPISRLVSRGGKERTGSIDVYFYTNDHFLIPRSRLTPRVYGSVLKQVEFEKGTSYYNKFHIRKNRVAKIDRKGQRCANDHAARSPGHCITKYLEDTYNCTAHMLMADKTKTFCLLENPNCT